MTSTLQQPVAPQLLPVQQASPASPLPATPKVPTMSYRPRMRTRAPVCGLSLLGSAGIRGGFSATRRPASSGHSTATTRPLDGRMARTGPASHNLVRDSVADASSHPGPSTERAPRSRRGKGRDGERLREEVRRHPERQEARLRQPARRVAARSSRGKEQRGPLAAFRSWTALACGLRADLVLSRRVPASCVYGGGAIAAFARSPSADELAPLIKTSANLSMSAPTTGSKANPKDIVRSWAGSIACSNIPNLLS